MKRLRHELGLALFAVQFLTRLPVPALLPFAPGLMGRAARYFTLAGALVGGLTGAVYAGLLWAGTPALPAAGLALGFQLLLTGGLHEDGLADAADGLGGGDGREAVLEIMRDSRIGSYGALALGISLMVRAGALAALGPLAGLAALVVAHGVARALVVASLVALPPARDEGLASAADAGGRELGVAMLTALVLALTFGWPGLAALVVAGIGWGFVSWKLTRRIGGHTGDGLGMTEQVAEVAALVVLAAAWS